MLHFLDSGAFGLYAREVKTKQFKRGEDHYAHYRTKAFRRRVDRYAAFVQKNKRGCDYYANLDVIYNPQLTWETQRYLEEEHGLNPIPVIHPFASIDWVHRYLDAGYTFIALGGFGGSKYVEEGQYMRWVSQIFEIICPPPKRVPIVKVHGFAMTNFKLLSMFPWWSVDSATWTKAASFGNVYIPKLKGDEFDLGAAPDQYTASLETSQLTKVYRPADGTHVISLSPNTKARVLRWLKEIDVPLGTVDRDGDAMQWGIVSHHGARKIANLKFFERMAKNFGEWPQPFTNPLRQRALLPIREVK